MTAPARIRLHPLDWKTSKGAVTTWHQTLGEGVEYVRADLMDAEIEKYRVAIEHTGRVVSDMREKCPQEAAGGSELRRVVHWLEHWGRHFQDSRHDTLFAAAELLRSLDVLPRIEPPGVALNGVDMLAIYGSPTGPDPWPMRDSGVE